MRFEATATYRLQLRPDFGFDQAAEVVPYLAELGISHVYFSPYLQATTGSTHGYDVVDPSHVNEELGGAEAHVRLCQCLLNYGLGQMIDVVPNHMAIGQQNPWWWNVLENGPASPYAIYFDVDWDSSEERWPNKVLLPVLGNHYGRVLEDGQLRLHHKIGVFTLNYFEHAFPVDSASLAGLLGSAAELCRSDSLAFIADCYAQLPHPAMKEREAVQRRQRDKNVLDKLLADLCNQQPDCVAAIDAQVARYNRDLDVLDSFIDQQNYRLAYWRTANRDLGYRRFFDINELAGLRVESLEVFQSTHVLPLRWVNDGVVQGLRIDHPDGLRDPAEYFRRLREACPNTWIVAEKILEPGEKLPPDWPIAGTTGYEFRNLVDGLFIAPEGEEALTRYYQEFTGEMEDFTVVVRECKRFALTELLGSEVNRLTSLFVAICERHRRHRDYTRHELQEALRETAICFPVYRSYVSAPKNVVGPQDEIYVSAAIDCVARLRNDLDPELFLFLKDLLLLRITGTLEAELVMRFQQLTSSAMAKGVEDTAYYRFHRLISLNEVGGNPGHFGATLEAFHEACSTAQTQHPCALLASTTHDTKRSEDVRARLALLSELSEHWAKTVHRWAGYNKRYLQDGMPERNTEYLFYQTLVGAWPIDEARLCAYMQKAVREAKCNTSWTKPNEPYEQALRDFIHAALNDQEFMGDVQMFVAPLVLPGRINGLAQTLIKLTAPGVPDVYQGTEMWDLSLVDPDNRRPVDFALRRRLLEALKTLSPEEMIARADEGLPKLWVIHQALQVRRSKPLLYGSESSYRSVLMQGRKAHHAVAFIRGESAITIVPRLVWGLGNDWLDTSVLLPSGQWRNVITGEITAGEKTLPMQEMLCRFPVALLIKDDRD